MGKHRKMVLALWLLLSCGLAFGVYKNFTAIDQCTTHEKVVMKEKIVDTSGIEGFAEDFAKGCFPWKNSEGVIERRMSNLERYLTENGLALIQDMVRADIPTSSEVQSVKILDVEEHSEEFVVSFLVEQHITGGRKTQSVSFAYRVTISEDENRDHLITSLPTMIGKPNRARYEARQVENDSEINAKAAEEVTGFLETFFKLYLSTSEKELGHYAENGTMRLVNIDLKFSELENPVYLQNGKNFLVNTRIRYLDSVSKATSYFQYKLVLRRNGNWRIADVE